MVRHGPKLSVDLKFLRPLKHCEYWAHRCAILDISLSLIHQGNAQVTGNAKAHCIAETDSILCDSFQVYSPSPMSQANLASTGLRKEAS